MRVRTHTNPLAFTHGFDLLDYKELLPTFNQSLDVEIGFGRGVFLQHWASLHPERLVLGVEVRKQLALILQERIDIKKLTNAKAFHGNGEIFIQDAIHNHSIDQLFLFHPDPWFKKRHHKRRVIRHQFLDICANKLKQTGKIHISTDVENLWDDMNESIGLDQRFTLIKNDPFWTTTYTSHWDQFSIREKRSRFCGTFTLKKDNESNK